VGKGHGRKEIRQILTTTALNEHLGWPGVGQVFELERVRELKGKAEVEVVHGVTSLTREQADAGRLLGLVREHWGIENGLHWVRDVTLGEDGCRVRTGSAPEVLAALRNVAVFLLAGLAAALGPGETRAGACDHLKANPNEALRLLGLPRIKSSNSR